MADSALIEKYGFKEEIYEKEDRQFGPTGFPKPFSRYRIIVEDFNMSLEQRYFWFVNYLQEEYAYSDIIKLVDVFSASENSSFFGASQQRLGLQQDKVSNFLATIGKMVKELFQLVRELRIMDERLSYYVDSYTQNRSRISAEITLKGIWIDMVEQGSKNPASVYGMSRELGFATLPDLFFSTHPHGPKDVDAVVDAMDFNRKVKEVLKRKLRTFLEWKVSTYEEMKTKRKFTLKYLRQHFDIIKLYMNWVKPYLRNIRRLQMDKTKMESADIISAFETSVIEIELLFKRPSARSKKVFECINVFYKFRTSPVMNYQQEYNKGPLHVGRLDVTIRSYAWTGDEINKYRALKQEEDFKLLSFVDRSVKIAMEALGDELLMYLKEAGETFDDDPDAFQYIPTPKKKQMPSSGFGSVFKGFGETFGSLSKRGGLSKNQYRLDMETARTRLKTNTWNTYKDFKKTFGHLAW